MENYPVISVNGPWYDLLYNLAFLVTLIILIYEGIRRKFPILKWILLLIISRFLFIVGTKIITFNQEQWIAIFTNFELPPTDKKSLLGGLLLGSAGLLGGYYLLQMRRNIIDAFALILPIGIAIQRIGCFLTGCCFGKVSNLPWAVRYPVHTLPHYHQFNDHLIGNGNTLSLPVHPVQLYEMLGMILVIGLLLFLQKKLKRPGSLFMASIILTFSIRFLDEFLRDAHAHTIGGNMIGIVNTTQLFLFPLVLILFLLLLRRERAGVAQKSPVPSTDLKLSHAFLILFVLSVMIMTFRNWLSFPERTVMASVFLVAVSIILFRIIRNIYISPHRWIYAAALILPMILMSQSFPHQDSVTVRKYTTIKIGTASGNFDNSNTLGTGEGCDRVSNTEYFNQKYTLAGGGVQFTRDKISSKLQTNYGMDLMVGQHEQHRYSDNQLDDKTFFSLSPYAKVDYNWFGIGAGMHVGSMSYVLENKDENGRGTPDSGYKESWIYPRLYARLGPRKWLFFDYHLADQFPSSLPGFRQQLGIGSGLGTDNMQLRFGSNLGEMSYVSGYFPIKEKVVIEPTFVWGKSPYDAQNQYQFSIGLGYRFGFQNVKVPAGNEISNGTKKSKTNNTGPKINHR